MKGCDTMDLLIKNASQIVTPNGIIEEGALAVSEGRITAVGTGVTGNAKKTIDASGKVVLPGFVDCHTHVVFGGSRVAEYEMKLQGKSYSDILKAGGGIHSTVKATKNTPAAELYERAFYHLKDMLSYGTTTVEMKSGYGIAKETELKILRVQKSLIQKIRHLTLKSTHLAHVLPHNTKARSRADYIDIQKQIIDKAAEEQLCDAFDVFCDRGAFTIEEGEELLAYAKAAGLALKIHAEQLSYTGATELAAKMGALSADHLEHISSKGIRALVDSGTIGVVLPGVSFHLQEKKLPPVQKMLDAGATLALSTDFNPGSSPVKSMQCIVGLACRLYKIPVLKAIEMATINGAKALDLDAELGSLEAGKAADIALYDMEDYRELGCSFGTNLIETVIKSGKIAWQRR